MKRVVYLFITLTLLLGPVSSHAETEPSFEPQVVGTAEKFDELMKEIFEQQSEQQYYDYGFAVNEAAPMPMPESAMDAAMPAPLATPAPAPAESSMAAGSGAGYSETNVQVAGVDEADIIKTDGKYVYHLSGEKLHIIKADTDGSLAEAGTIDLTADADNYYYFTDFYLDGDTLCLIGSRQRRILPEPFVSSPRIGRPADVWYGIRDSYITVQNWDITDRSKPVLKREFDVEGSLVSTRKVGTKLYLVVNHYLQFYGVDLPRYAVPEFYDSLSEGDYEQVTFGSMQYFPGRYDSTMLIVAALDLSKSEPAEVSSLLGSGSEVYMSREALYVTHYDYGYTIYSSTDALVGGMDTYTSVFKFGVSGGLKYLARGVASGRVLNQYSMDEYGGFFRIATTGDKDGESVNTLTIFDADMKRTGIIDDMAPGEQIYSARFIGAKAFMVTYRTVDPLFAMDLSDPYNPKVLGELKIPGYSSYLHPYDDDHLIGFGRDTEEMRTINSKDEVVNTWAENRGLKLSMFDVTDMTKPIESDVESIGDQSTNTELMYNPKVFLFDKARGIALIPAYHYGGDTEGFKSEQLNGIMVFSVTADKIDYVGTINGRDASSYYDRLERAVFIGDIYYSVSGTGIQSNAMSDLRLLDYLAY
jgi:uncharacterized secreted protein with C-terminal beta-propeller domain